MLARVIAELDGPVEIWIMHEPAFERDPMPISPGRPADDRGARGARQFRACKRRVPAATRFRPYAPGQRREHRGHVPHIQAMIGRARKGARYGAIRAAGEHGDNGNTAIAIVELSNVAHASEVRQCEAENQLPQR